MNAIDEILSSADHRPYKMPGGRWIYYQEWNRALFLHWRIPYELLRECVPKGLEIDVFEGSCYISLVAFTMEKIRPRFLPSLGIISNFDEINLRTYIDNGGRRGVYFLNIEAGKALSSFVAKAISGLPYEKSGIKRSENAYTSANIKKGFRLNAEFEIKERITEKSSLDRWLTERYCLYLEKGRRLYRYDIHHKEWALNKVEIKNLELKYKVCDIDLEDKRPHYAHYSEGVKVVAWKKEGVKPDLMR